MVRIRECTENTLMLLRMCIHTLNARKAMAVQFQNGLGLENRKISQNHKQGKKIPPNTGPIAGPRNFSLRRR